MQKFSLDLFLHIIGIGSASGLFYHDATHSVYLISDNSGYLYEYNIAEKSLEKIKILDSPVLENISKKDKPDLESIAQMGDQLCLVGSGSTPNRDKSYTYDFNTKKVNERDLSPLYRRMKDFAKLTDDDFNIEGIVFYDDDIFFLQRGNGAKGKNGIFVVPDSKEDTGVKFYPYELPKVRNVAFTFTDAVFYDNKIYFLAAAENSASTYLDGNVLGSMVGVIDIATMKITNSEIITAEHKFEGIALFGYDNVSITFLLCEDNDSDKLETTLYKLVLDKSF